MLPSISLSLIFLFVALTLRLVLPNLLTLILSHYLGYSQTAATWSVAASDLEAGQWPWLLGTDSSNSCKVKPIVRFLGRAREGILLLILVASTLSPFGYTYYRNVKHIKVWFSTADSQYDFRIHKYDPPKRVSINQISDKTYKRPENFRFSRICASSRCPNFSKPNLTYQVRVPEEYFKLFQSGLLKQKPTVSSIFDIQWRQYSKVNTNGYNNDEPFEVGKYSQLGTFLLDTFDNTIDVKGLIVQHADEPGIGFRSATAPNNTKSDVHWREDILFFQPKTSCVDTNFTLRLGPYQTDNGELGLIDHGNPINRGREQFKPLYQDMQLHPQLRIRAWRGARQNYLQTIKFLNFTQTSLKAQTDTDFGASTISPLHFLDVPVRLDTITSTPYGKYLGRYGQGSLQTSNDIEKNHFNDATPADEFLEESKLNGAFESARDFCTGATGNDVANISQVAISCGLVWGMPRPMVDKSQVLATDNVKWTRPLYSCATTVKASVRTVWLDGYSFRHQSYFESKRSRPRVYMNEAKVPTWGVENPGPDFPIGNIAPIWGLVDENVLRRYKSNISVRTAKHLFLPGYPYSKAANSRIFDSGALDSMNLPGANFHLSLLKYLYEIEEGTFYSGANNLKLSRSWKRSSKTARGTADMMNLIWTDIAMNALYGTRGWTTMERSIINPSEDMNEKERSRLKEVVAIREYRMTYELPYASPGFLLLFLSIVILLWAIWCLVFGTAGSHRIRYYLHRLSVGRLIILGRERDNLNIHTRKWIKRFGHRIIDLRSSRYNGSSSDIPLEETIRSSDTSAITRPYESGNESFPNECDSIRPTRSFRMPTDGQRIRSTSLP